MNEHTKHILRLLREPIGEEVPAIQRWAADEIERLRSRANEAERIILLLTANHHSEPEYVEGYDAAQAHFARYADDA